MTSAASPHHPSRQRRRRGEPDPSRRARLEPRPERRGARGPGRRQPRRRAVGRRRRRHRRSLGAARRHRRLDARPGPREQRAAPRRVAPGTLSRARVGVGSFSRPPAHAGGASQRDSVTEGNGVPAPCRVPEREASAQFVRFAQRISPPARGCAVSLPHTVRKIAHPHKAPHSLPLDDAVRYAPQAPRGAADDYPCRTRSRVFRVADRLVGDEPAGDAATSASETSAGTAVAAGANARQASTATTSRGRFHEPMLRRLNALIAGR